MKMRAGLLALVASAGAAAAASLPVVPYPRDYQTSLVRYAVVDRVDGFSRDLYVSRDALEAVRRDPIAETGVVQYRACGQPGRQVCPF